MAGKRRKSRGAKARVITAVLAGGLAAFCVASSIQDKYGVDLGLPRLSGLSLAEWAESALGRFWGDSPLPVSAPAGSEAAPGLTVHFIDVGQAQSILIESDGEFALIDAGENEQGELVLSYLRARGAKKLEFALGTHPHSDHIGGLDTVLREIETKAVILPDIPEAIVPTTKTFTDLLLTIAEEGHKITPAKPGESFTVGGAELEVLGPAGEYDNLNDISAAARLDFGGVSFLFTGDIEAGSERDLARSGRELKATVLSVSHHGSNTSGTPEFLGAVRPDYAVISCGLDNSYGHPHRETMEALDGLGARIYRTDLDGTVVFSTDGDDISVETGAG